MANKPSAAIASHIPYGRRLSMVFMLIPILGVRKY
jgi:hypothetical protein